MTQYLPVGYKLNNQDCSGEYTVKKIVGRGASTIAYLTEYKSQDGRKTERILKEYYPQNIDVFRDENGTIICAEKNFDKYNDGMGSFIAGGNRQNELRNRTYLKNETPPLLQIFKANNTCYLDVTPFEGKTFDNIDTFSFLERMKLCLTTSKLIRRYHEEGFLYLDLKPENMFVLTNSAGEVVTDLIEFIDFDSIIEKENISFGCSLSFTESWAAPEQINPHGFSKISERTDIYSIGELVFWCVFGRHSFPEEHRGFSTYPFDEADTPFINSYAEDILTKIFKGTLRSSVENRFKKMDEVILLLEKLTDELSKKERISQTAIRPKEFFVGREKELDELNSALQQHDTVFVCGILGIGKSEIIKQYIHIHQKEYSNILYWQYDGNLVSMVCDESAVSIDNFMRFPKEDDEEYCQRKLQKIISLADRNTLIVIDNIDKLIEELEPQKIWRLIKSIPGKMLIGSRCDEQHYCKIRIEEIRDTETLKNLFLNRCQFEEEQSDFVKQIIEIANYHTYEIELLAAYTKAKRQMPEDTLHEMNNQGFSDFGTASISVLKDGDSPAMSFEEHMVRLLAMSKLTEEQQKLLLKMAYLPVTGIAIKEISKFYSFADLNDINWLISHGFVFISSDKTQIITVHSSVSHIVIDIAKDNPEILKSFYESSLVAMRKGYDDASVNQGFYDRICEYVKDKKFISKLAKQGIKTETEIHDAVEKVRKNFAEEYAASEVSQTEYFSCCNGIVEKTVSHNIQSIEAAHFITQYVEWFMKYGHYSLLKMLIKYALNIYDEKCTSKYNSDREYAYSVYSGLLLLQDKGFEEVIKLSSEHLRTAKKEKDWSMASYWCANLAKAHFCMSNVVALKFQFIGAYYTFKSISRSKKQRRSFDDSFSPNISKSNIRSAELNESLYNLYPPSDCGTTIFNLKMAINSRKKAINSFSSQSPSDNEIRIAIDEARIMVLQLNFAEARKKLISTIEPYRSGTYQFTLASVDACEMLGDVLMVGEHYSMATDAYKSALNIAKLLDKQDVFLLMVKMGRALNLSMQLDEAKTYNINVLNSVKDAVHKEMQHIVADAYYNVADHNFLSANYDEAFKNFEKALSLYESATILRLHNNIGKARCNERLAYIMKQNDFDSAKSLMKKAVTLLEEMLGKEHPEVKRFNNELQSFNK